MTQAEISKHVRGLVKALQAGGLTVTGAKVTFTQGSPIIEVSTAESVTAAGSKPEAVDVEELKARIGRAHARRS